MSTSCPSHDELRRFAAGHATDGAGELSRHVADCLACSTSVVALRRELESTSAGATLTATATRTIAPGGTPAGMMDVPQSVGPVDVQRCIGRGGMGVVHLGRDRLLGRDVAVKFLLNAVAGENDPRFEEFLAGARNAAKVRHPNLVSLHQASLVSDMPCLLMEFVDGPTLRDVIQVHGTLRPAVALRILRDTASAVAALHENGTIHRDIKPSNILFNAEGHLFVTDFGLSCARPRDSDDRSLRVSGSPPYMAPEMFEGEVSPRTDVYALGMMLYEMLTGSAPFTGSFAEVRARHEEEAIPLEPLDAAGVGGELMQLIERALHKRDLFRFKTARELIRALDSCGVVPANDIDMQRCIVLCRAAGVRSTSDENTPGSSGSASYFDRLRELASAKQETRGSDEPAIERPSHSGESEVVLLDRVLCLGCNADLVGLAMNDVCPSCGAAVASSFDRHLLSRADPGWLRRMARGLATLRTLLLAGPAVRVALELFAVVLPSWHATALPAAPWAYAILWGLITLLALVGVRDAAAAEPGRSRVLSLCATGLCSAALLALVAAIATAGLAVPVAPIVLRVLHPPLLLAGVLLALIHHRRVAARVPAVGLARAVTAGALLVTCAALVNAATDGVVLATDRGLDRLVASVALFTGLALLGSAWWTSSLLRQQRTLILDICRSSQRP